MIWIINLLFLSGCFWLPVPLQDNPVEETIEQVIEKETGIEIDFTGDSHEKDEVQDAL